MKTHILTFVAAFISLAAPRAWGDETTPGEAAAHLTEHAVLKPDVRPRKGLPPPLLCLNSLAFSPDGKILAAAESFHELNPRLDVRLWDVARAKEVAVLSGGTVGLSFSPDGTTLATWGDRKIMLWDIAICKATTTLKSDHRVGSVAFTPGGKTLLAFGKGALTEWDLETRKELRDIPVPSSRFGVALCSSAKRPLLCILHPDKDKPDVMSCTLLDPLTGKEVFTCTGHRAMSGIVCDAAEKTVVSMGFSSVDHVVRVWDWRTGKTTATFEYAPGTTNTFALSPDGKLLVYAHASGFCLYEVPSGKILAEDKVRAVVRLAFSPDGRFLATGDNAGFITIWSVPAAWRKKK